MCRHFTDSPEHHDWQVEGYSFGYDIPWRFITKFTRHSNFNHFISSSWDNTITLLVTPLHFRFSEMSVVHNLLTCLTVWGVSESLFCVVLASGLGSMSEGSLEQPGGDGTVLSLLVDDFGPVGGCTVLLTLFRYAVITLKNCSAAVDTCSSSCSCRCWFRSICLSFSINCLM